jgi:hypothetical protein
VESTGSAIFFVGLNKPSVINISHAMFINSDNNLDISGDGDIDFYVDLNCENVINCISRSGDSGISTYVLCDPVTTSVYGRVLLPGDVDRSYLLSYYHPSPFYVASVSVSREGDIEFSAVNNLFCGSINVRCLTISYARSLFEPNSNYTVNVYHGLYEENVISIGSGEELILNGESRDSSVITGRFEQGICVVIFIFYLFFLFRRSLFVWGGDD